MTYNVCNKQYVCEISMAFNKRVNLTGKLGSSTGFRKESHSFKNIMFCCVEANKTWKYISVAHACLDTQRCYISVAEARLEWVFLIYNNFTISIFCSDPIILNRNREHNTRGFHVCFRDIMAGKFCDCCCFPDAQLPCHIDLVSRLF